MLLTVCGKLRRRLAHVENGSDVKGFGAEIDCLGDARGGEGQQVSVRSTFLARPRQADIAERMERTSLPMVFRGVRLVDS